MSFLFLVSAYLGKMQGNRLKEYTETVESGRVDEDISTSSICNVKHIGPASEIAGDSSPSLSQEVMKKASTRANISNVIHPKIQQNRPIPAAAPLLTTDRTHTRIARRFKRGILFNDLFNLYIFRTEFVKQFVFQF